MRVFTVIFKINVNYDLVIIVRFCHLLIVHDDETVISYFMPRHQTLKFSYNFKVKIQCDFDEQKSIGTQAFWGIYL